MDSRGESVVRIHLKNHFLGTGFLVHRTNDASFVLTCHHVIREFLKTSITPRIFFPNGDKFDASIVKEDESVDLALLRYPDVTTSASPRALQFSPPGALYVGGVELIAYFAPNGAVTLRPGISTGLTIGEPTCPMGGYMHSVCNISNEVSQGGTSGGPLMANEKVVGVHTAGGAGIRFSILAEDIYTALWKWSKATREGIEISEMLATIAAETATPSSSAPTVAASSSK